jgi:hypothetical protein
VCCAAFQLGACAHTEGEGDEVTAATTAEAVAPMEAQGRLAPGEEGWWEVWGAGLRHVRPRRPHRHDGR